MDQELAKTLQELRQKVKLCSVEPPIRDDLSTKDTCCGTMLILSVLFYL